MGRARRTALGLIVSRGCAERAGRSLVGMGLRSLNECCVYNSDAGVAGQSHRPFSARRAWMTGTPRVMCMSTCSARSRRPGRSINGELARRRWRRLLGWIWPKFGVELCQAGIERIDLVEPIEFLDKRSGGQSRHVEPNGFRSRYNIIGDGDGHTSHAQSIQTRLCEKGFSASYWGLPKPYLARIA